MIDTKALRQKILSLAIQGKLTEQLPEDGTGEDLYKQIKEKNSNKKNNKDFFPIIAEEIPYSIPDSWKWIRLGEAIELLSGVDLLPEEYNSSGVGIPYMTGASNVENDRLLINRWTNTPKNIAIKGDILLVCKGSVGKMAICDIPMVHIARQFMAIRCNNGVETKYVMAVLSYSVEMIRSEGKGIIPGIDRKTVSDLLLPLPPTKEQIKIIDELGKLFIYVSSIEQLQDKIQSNKKALKKDLVDVAIQGKLTKQLPEDGTAEELYQQIQEEKRKLEAKGRIKKEKKLPSVTEDEIPFDTPDNWKWVRCSDIMMSISTGPFGSMLHKNDYIIDGIPLINPANIIDERIIPSEKMMISQETKERLSSYVLNAGMIVMGRRGEMGRCAIITENEDGWVCGTGSFFMEPAEQVYPAYLLKLFSSQYAKKYLSSASVGTTMNNLNLNILNGLPIPLPPLAEQKRIVAKLEELLSLCE